MADIDELLKGSFERLAEPANSAGVADAIRSRVTAGDAGASVAGSTAPGWSGGGAGIMSWLPWVGLVVVAGVVGGTLGATGVVGAGTGPAGGDVPVYATSAGTAPVYACPGGPSVGEIVASTRVLAVARDADGAFLGVRGSGDPGATIWLESEDLVLDAGGPELSSLPVQACAEATVTIVTPTPDPEPEPTGEPTGDPRPPGDPADGLVPLIAGGQWMPNNVMGSEALPYCTNTSDITVTASDDVGVTAVTGATNRAGTSVTLIGSSGELYMFRFTAGSYPSGGNVQVAVTFTARDAAGNTNSVVRPITLVSAGNCII